MGRKQLTPGGEVRKGACMYCGGDIHRTLMTLADGSQHWDAMGNFLRRKYCCTRCAQLDSGRKHKARAEKLRDAKAKAEDAMNRFIYGW